MKKERKILNFARLFCLTWTNFWTLSILSLDRIPIGLKWRIIFSAVLQVSTRWPTQKQGVEVMWFQLQFFFFFQIQKSRCSHLGTLNFGQSWVGTSCISLIFSATFIYVAHFLKQWLDSYVPFSLIWQWNDWQNLIFSLIGVICLKVQCLLLWAGNNYYSLFYGFQWRMFTDKKN